VLRRARWRREEGPRYQPQADRTAPEAVRRNQPVAGEVGDGADGVVQPRPAPAAGAPVGALFRSGARSARRSGHRAAIAHGGETGLRISRVALAIAVAGVLGGCTATSSMLEGKKVDYKAAGSLPSLEVPPGLTTPARDHPYIVPETGKSNTNLSGYHADREQQAKTGNLAAGVLPDVEKMRIERQGNQRWLVVTEPPEKLWPLVRDFWQENGFLIAVNIPEAGVMETDWAENRAKIPQDWLRNTLGKLLDSLYSTSERDKVRTPLEPHGGGRSEIH